MDLLLPSNVFKCACLLLLLFVAIKVYEFLVRPWLVRRKYLKYENVSMCRKFYPLLGDVAVINQEEQANKCKMFYYVETALARPNTDIYVTQFGPLSLFEVCSPRAYDQIENLVPTKIDRHDHKGFPMGNLAYGGFALIQSHANWNERRKFAMKTLGINYASQYIPLMIETVDDWAKNVKLNETIDLSCELWKIGFRIISKMLFGRDSHKMSEFTYLSPKDGSTSKIPFEDFFFLYMRDEFDAYLNFTGHLVPLLARLKITNPYKTNFINNQELYRSVRAFLAQSEDDQSVYRRILDSNKFDPEDVLKDTIVLLFAGFDTTAHGITSMLYYLKKYPDCMKKLKAEVADPRLPKFGSNPGDQLKDIYENFEYLNCVVKEGLRIDPPVPSSLIYFAKEDVTIWDVPISKGSKITINVMISHYNPKIWHKPESFIPERFDPEHEEYLLPGEKSTETRHPKSFNPFTFGSRNCVGQTMAKLEAKVVLSRLVSVIDYEIDSELLQNECARFNIISQIKLTGKVLKVHSG